LDAGLCAEIGEAGDCAETGLWGDAGLFAETGLSGEAGVCADTGLAGETGLTVEVGLGVWDPELSSLLDAESVELGRGSSVVSRVEIPVVPAMLPEMSVRLSASAAATAPPLTTPRPSSEVAPTATQVLTSMVFSYVVECSVPGLSRQQSSFRGQMRWMGGLSENTLICKSKRNEFSDV
jgi:hypothetical protein